MIRKSEGEERVGVDETVRDSFVSSKERRLEGGVLVIGLVVISDQVSCMNDGFQVRLQLTKWSPSNPSF